MNQQSTSVIVRHLDFLQIGTYFYTKTKEYILGRGTFGEVFKGYVYPKSIIEFHALSEYKKKQLDKVAIKTFNLRNDRYIELADKEISILKGLKHPNIVKFLNSVKKGKDLFLIMEYCQDGNLQELMQKQKLSVDRILSIFKEIVKATSFAAQNNKFHRDLKPANILLKGGVVKVADFGVGKMLDISQQFANTIIGTPRYMAPQICPNNKYKPEKSDIWSLGVMLYDMCFPFKQNQAKNSKFQAFLKSAKKMEQTPFQPPEGLDLTIASVLGKLLIVDPEKRLNYKQLRKVLDLEDEEAIEDSTDIAKAEMLMHSLQDLGRVVKLSPKLALQIGASLITILRQKLFKTCKSESNQHLFNRFSENQQMLQSQASSYQVDLQQNVKEELLHLTGQFIQSRQVFERLTGRQLSQSREVLQCLDSLLIVGTLQKSISEDRSWNIQQYISKRHQYCLQKLRKRCARGIIHLNLIK